MKKIFSILILLFFTGTNTCFAFSELHYFKSINVSNVATVVRDSLVAENFEIQKENPYYAVSRVNDGNVVIILQQSGDNMFYYYQSNKNTRVNKLVLKEMKKRGITCEQSFNTNIIGIYDDIASVLLANQGEQNQYTFVENKSDDTNANNSSESTVSQQQTFSGYIGQLASGTKFNVYLKNAINTSTASVGDSVNAVITDDVSYNGTVIIPQGSEVYGTLSKARSAGYGSRNGRVVILFKQVVTPDNVVYNIDAESIDFDVENEGKVTESAKSAVTSAAVGAILGLLVGAISGSDHIWRSAAIGAGVGAGSSVAHSAIEKGVDAEIPSFTEMEVTLIKPLNISVVR